LLVIGCRIFLRVHWYNIIASNAHTTCEEKNGDSEDSFYEELERVFRYFPKYHIKILLVTFNVELGRDGGFKKTIGNESLHQDSNNNGVGIVNFSI
jgi:hypothetical protein